MNTTRKWLGGLSESAKDLKQTRVMVSCALLLAIQVVLNLTASIYVTGYIRISFGFLATAACGYLFGPSPAMLIAAASDILVWAIRPAGAYFPGYTLSAALVGLAYGLIFYKKDISLPRILLAQGVVAAIVHIALNTLWSSIFLGKGYIALLPARALKNLAQYPVDVALLSLLLHFIKRRFRDAQRL